MSCGCYLDLSSVAFPPGQDRKEELSHGNCFSTYGIKHPSAPSSSRCLVSQEEQGPALSHGHLWIVSSIWRVPSASERWRSLKHLPGTPAPSGQRQLPDATGTKSEFSVSSVKTYILKRGGDGGRQIELGGRGKQALPVEVRRRMP